MTLRLEVLYTSASELFNSYIHMSLARLRCWLLHRPLGKHYIIELLQLIRTCSSGLSSRGSGLRFNCKSKIGMLKLQFRKASYHDYNNTRNYIYI